MTGPLVAPALAAPALAAPPPAVTTRDSGSLDPSGYEAGACNIGPAEIARRRRVGHVGAIAAVALLIVLIAIDAPPLAALLVALPAALAASGYLQAHLRFCANYGARGVYNLGAIGTVESVADATARHRDRRRAASISLASGAIGLAVAGIAVVLSASL